MAGTLVQRHKSLFAAAEEESVTKIKQPGHRGQVWDRVGFTCFKSEMVKSWDADFSLGLANNPVKTREQMSQRLFGATGPHLPFFDAQGYGRADLSDNASNTENLDIKIEMCNFCKL